MIIAGLVLAALAAALHVYIFYMESIAWTSPKVRAAFGTTAEEAETTKSLAFNQGFYNLFLAISVFVGLAVYAAGHEDVGATLVLVGIGSMAAAALVLFGSAAQLRGAALKQGLLPVVAIALLVAGLALQ